MAWLLAAAAGLLMLGIVHLIVVDELDPPRWDPPPTRHQHPCWSEQDPARLRAAAATVRADLDDARRLLAMYPAPMGQPS